MTTSDKLVLVLIGITIVQNIYFRMRHKTILEGQIILLRAMQILIESRQQRGEQPISFPYDPSVGDVFEFKDKSWIFDGDKWVLMNRT